jgi:hypothetical protein
MPAPAWENTAQFVDLDDFGIQVTITSADGQSSRLIKAIFDDPYMDKQLGEYSAADGDPRLTCQEVDVAGIKKHDECVVAGMPGKYTVVRDPMLSGNGFATVYMARIE